MEIKKINHGIACRVGDTIYINKKIKGRLYKALIKHEKEHTSGYTIKDISIDLGGKHLEGVKKEYYQFIINNPSSLTIFVPIWIYEKTLTIDPLMSLIWILVIIGVILI